MNSHDLIKIQCSRFDNHIVDYIDDEVKVVNYSPVVISRNNTGFVSISSSSKYVFDGGRFHLISDYFKEASKDLKYIVLTDRELGFILRYSVRYMIDVYSLESRYPIFPDIRYIDDLKLNFKYLNKCLKELKGMGVHGNSIQNNYNHSLIKTLSRKIHKKTSLDKQFALAYLPPFQEVFTFSESRPGRTVLALDFNSMYASCMEGMFLDPASLYKKELFTTYNNEKVELGLYRVVLNKPKENIFRSFHPFKMSRLCRSFSFELDDKLQIEANLFSFEIEFYSKYFESVFLISCILSSKKIGHPLYNESKRLYRLRMAARSKSKNLERLYKFRLAMLHSLTNPFILRWKNFYSKDDLLKELNKGYGIDTLGDSGFFLCELNKSKYFNFVNASKGVALGSLDLDSKSTIYSFSAQITALARLKICERIESFLLFGDVELCYVNADSIHISISSDRLDEFLKCYNDVIGDCMGKLKVQAVGDSGAWFDIGQYFIFKEKKVVKFKSAVVNHKGNTDPFIKNRRVYKVFKSENFKHVVSQFLTFGSSLTYKKALDIDTLQNFDFEGLVKFKRYSYNDIIGFEDLSKRQNAEIISSSSLKGDFFSKLQSVYKI